MKIKTIVVIDENDVQHRFDGIEGHVQVRTDNYKGEPTAKSVTAYLRMEPGQVEKA